MLFEIKQCGDKSENKNKKGWERMRPTEHAGCGIRSDPSSPFGSASLARARVDASAGFLRIHSMPLHTTITTITTYFVWSGSTDCCSSAPWL